MKTTLYFTVLCILSFVSVGCHNPKDEFEAHVQTLERSITNKLAEPVRYDIRKTDSIVSPMVGQIEYTEITDYTNGPPLGVTWWGKHYRLTLAYQSDKWVLTKAETRVVGSLIRDENEMRWFDHSSYTENFKKMLGMPYDESR